MAAGAGLQIFREVQTGLEVGSTPGTPVVATTILPGITKVESKESRTKYRPQFLNGTLFPYRTTTSTFAFAPIRLEGLLAAENFGYILGMALKGGVSGVTDSGTPAAYLYPYQPTGTSEDAPDLRTLEVKDTAYDTGGTRGFQYPSVYGSNLTIGGKLDEDLTFQTDLVGQKETHNFALTGSLALPAAFNPFPFSGLGKSTSSASGLWIDDTGGTLGTTLFPGCLRSFSLSFDSFMYHRCASLYYSSVHQRPLNPKLTLEMEVNGSTHDSLTYLTEYQADTRVLVRLLVVGNQVIRTVTSATTAPTLGATGTLHTLAAGNYYAKYTWVTEAGESQASAESIVQAVTSGQQLDITVPALPTGVVGWNLYLTPVNGATGTETGPQNATPYTTTTAHFGTAYAAKSAPPAANTATVNNFFQIDFAGQITDPSSIGTNQVDGIELMTFTLESEYDAGVAGGGVLKLAGRNSLSAFP